MVFFGATAMFLAAIAIYGLMANLVFEHTHEIGIRTASEASPRQVMDWCLGRDYIWPWPELGSDFSFRCWRAEGWRAC